MSDSNTEKIIQAVANGLSTLRMEMLQGFKKVHERIDKLEITLNGRIDGVEERLDIIGKQVAYLEDDAPTREEFDTLEKKVKKHILKPSHHSTN